MISFKYFSKKERKNIVYLYIVQIVNQLFPIITMPILISGLGLNDYGIIQFALSVASYSYLVGDYGFALNGPKSIVKSNKNINKIYYSIQSTRLILTGFFYFFIAIFFYITDIYRVYEKYVLIFSIYSIGMVAFPVWFFQGKEELQYSSTITLLIKFIQTFLLINVIKIGKGILEVSLIYGVLNIIQAMVAHIFIVSKFKLKFYKPSMLDIWLLLKDGWTLFVGQAATSLFSSVNVMLLGAMSTPEKVAIYATGEKIVRASCNFLGPISRVVFPISCKKFLLSKEEGKKYVVGISKIIIPIFMLGSLLLFLLSNQIAAIISTYNIIEIAIIIKILSLLPTFITINNMAGTQIMVNMGEEKALRNFILLTGIINIFTAIMLIPFLDEFGMAISSWISELFLMVATVYFVKRNYYSDN